MKRFFFSLLFSATFFLPCFQVHAGVIDITTSTSPQETSTSPSLLRSIANYQKMQQVLVGLNVELEQEQNRTFDEEKDVQETLQRLKAINSEILALEQEGKDTTEKKKEREKIRFQLEEKKKAYDEAFEIHLKKIKQIKTDIENAKTEIIKLKEIAKNQAITLATRVGFFLGLILLLLIIRYIVGKMISRLSGKIPIPRSRALHRMNTIVFNILIALTIIAVLFSQALSILPVLAILGTAFAFALRNVIASFIAWFVIGTEQGYKIGDLIEVQSGSGNRFRGRVLEVHPLITVLRQTGMRGDTGQIVTFPNKIIFEDHIRNFSKMYRFTYIIIDFLLEDGSDVEAARKALYDAIYESIEKDIEDARKNLPNLQTKFGITEEQIQPQIFIEPDPKGILLRGKYFCRLDSRHKSRTEITRHFLEKIKNIPSITLRFVQFGDND